MNGKLHKYLKEDLYPQGIEVLGPNPNVHFIEMQESGTDWSELVVAGSGFNVSTILQAIEDERNRRKIDRIYKDPTPKELAFLKIIEASVNRYIEQVKTT
jgi:NAD(P)H-flavin reductase